MVYWSLTEETAPAAEPVSTAEQKAHMRVTGSGEDTLIDTYVSTARQMVEEWAGRAFIDTTFALHLDKFPAKAELQLPRAPLSSVSNIQYVDTAGDTQTFSSASYHVDTDAKPGRIVLDQDDSWPSDVDQRPGAVTINYVSGYGAASTDVPLKWVSAVKILAAHFYCNREAMTAVRLEHVPMSVQAIINTDRVWYAGP